METKETLWGAILHYCKLMGMTPSEIKKELLDIAIDLHNTPSMDSSWRKDYDLGDPRHKKLSEFHHRLVQETIDFLGENPEVTKMIDSKRKEIEEKVGYSPDLRLHFGIECLDPSLQEGEWVPATDSSLGLYLAEINVILSA